MNFRSELTKRRMHQPEAFRGMAILSGRWLIPDGWYRCAMTGKLYPESELTGSFNHTVFDKSFLLAHGIYVEHADWLSEQGEDQIHAVLYDLGLLDAYHEAASNPYFSGVVNPECWRKVAGR